MARGRATLAVALLVVVAGCAGTGPSTTQPTTRPGASFPEPPADLSTDAVERVAIDYVEATVVRQLQNASAVESFDVGYFYPPEATIIDRTDEGVTVRVVVHYSYTTGDRAADGVPVRAVVRVTRRDVEWVRTLSGSQSPEDVFAGVGPPDGL